MNRDERYRRATVKALSPSPPIPLKATDDALGMKWWNALNDRERKRWMQIAGNTGRAVDAWEAFKRAGHREPELPAVSRSSHYS
jgi:hypothetical protein